MDNIKREEIAQKWMEEVGFIVSDMSEDLNQDRTSYESLMQKFMSAYYALSEIAYG